MGLMDNVREFLWQNLKDTGIGKFGPVERLIEPKDEEYQHFKRSKQSILSDINRFNEYLQENRTKDDRLRWEYALHEAERKLEFARPNTQEDIDYRRRVGQEFAAKLQEVTGNLDLRFHGTPLHFAEEIIKSGQISSSADRWDGYNQSTDGHGVFSVSDIDSLPRTVNWFLNVESHVQSQPCGCLFVLTPGNQTEEQRNQSIMDSVDLWNNPERLHSIVTTPENVERVQQWCKDMHMDPTKVHTFDDFVELAREEALELKQQQIQSQEFEQAQQSLKQEQSQTSYDQLIQDFKVKYMLPDMAPLYTDGKKIFVDIECVDKTINSSGEVEITELDIPLELLEINQNNPEDLETGANIKHINAFKDAIIEQKLYQEVSIQNQEIPESEIDIQDLDNETDIEQEY